MSILRIFVVTNQVGFTSLGDEGEKPTSTLPWLFEVFWQLCSNDNLNLIDWYPQFQPWQDISLFQTQDPLYLSCLLSLSLCPQLSMNISIRGTFLRLLSISIKLCHLQIEFLWDHRKPKRASLMDGSFGHYWKMKIIWLGYTKELEYGLWNICVIMLRFPKNSNNNWSMFLRIIYWF